jgi:uncharacterized membrane protein YfcA
MNTNSEKPVSEPNAAVLVLVGVVVGAFSGLMGLGGGSVMIPVMVLGFTMTQQKAHGTSLAVMCVPVVLPAVLKYWRHDNVDWRIALWMAAGFVLGSFFGALLANRISVGALKLVFGFLLIYVAGYTVFAGERVGRGVVVAAVTVAFAVLLWAGMRWYDRRFATEAASGTSSVSASTGLPENRFNHEGTKSRSG